MKNTFLFLCLSLLLAIPPVNASILKRAFYLSLVPVLVVKDAVLITTGSLILRTMDALGMLEIK